jgi:hypothetical protein
MRSSVFQQIDKHLFQEQTIDMDQREIRRKPHFYQVMLKHLSGAMQGCTDDLLKYVPLLAGGASSRFQS